MEANPFRKRKYQANDETNEIVFKKGETIDITEAFQKRKEEIEKSTPWYEMKQSLIARGLIAEPSKAKNVMKEREAKHREYIIKDSAKQKPDWDSFNETIANPEDKKEKVFKKFPRKKTEQEHKLEDEKVFKKFPRKETEEEQNLEDEKEFKKISKKKKGKGQKNQNNNEIPLNNTNSVNQNPKKSKNKIETLKISIEKNEKLSLGQTNMIKDIITKSKGNQKRNFESVVEELRTKGLVRKHDLKKIFKVKP